MHLKFSHLARNTNSNKMNNIGYVIATKESTMLGKASVMLTGLESAQVDQIVNVYSNAWLYKFVS